MINLRLVELEKLPYLCCQRLEMIKDKLCFQVPCWAGNRPRRHVVGWQTSPPLRISRSDHYYHCFKIGSNFLASVPRRGFFELIIQRARQGLFELSRRPSRDLDSPRALLPELQRNKNTVRCAVSILRFRLFIGINKTFPCLVKQVKLRLTTTSKRPKTIANERCLLG